MDRFFCRDFLIFVTYSLAVYWGIYLERSVQEIRDQNRPSQCSPVSEALVKQVPMPTPPPYPMAPSYPMLDSPALTAPCPITGYRSDSSVEDCSPCPANSATREIGATMVEQCLCDAGYEGIIMGEHDTCSQCPPYEYSEIGSARCTLSVVNMMSNRFLRDTFGWISTPVLELCGRDMDRTARHLYAMRKAQLESSRTGTPKPPSYGKECLG